MSKNFFKKLAKSKEAFKEGREGRTSMVNMTVDQKAIVRLHSIDLDVNKDDVPFVMFNMVCVASEIEDEVGNEAKHRFEIKERKGKSKKTGKPYHITEAECFSQICTALQKFGYGTDDLELEELGELASTIADEQPACRIMPIANGDFVNVKFIKFVEDETLPAIEEVSNGAFDDDEEEDEEDDVDVDDDDVDDDVDDDDHDDDDFVPTKGGMCSAKPKGTKKYEDCKIRTVSMKNETCTLVRERDDKVFKAVPFSMIEAADDAE